MIFPITHLRGGGNEQIFTDPGDTSRLERLDGEHSGHRWLC